MGRWSRDSPLAVLGARQALRATVRCPPKAKVVCSNHAGRANKIKDLSQSTERRFFIGKHGVSIQIDFDRRKVGLSTLRGHPKRRSARQRRGTRAMAARQCRRDPRSGDVAPPPLRCPEKILAITLIDRADATYVARVWRRRWGFP